MPEKKTRNPELNSQAIQPKINHGVPCSYRTRNHSMDHSWFASKINLRKAQLRDAPAQWYCAAIKEEDIQLNKQLLN